MTKHLIDCSALLRDFPEDTRTSMNIHVSRYSCKTDGGTPCLAEHMFSASPPTTDMRQLPRNGRFVPTSDMEVERRNSILISSQPD
jgi:hypothetical protein